jgi:prepilin-type N-terminal cleavage/methylation domain-containing protein
MKKAFTLIELLVVIAIIAILAAILFPVFAQAKVAAKKTQSLSNLKQSATGFMIYTTDYDDNLPSAYSRVNGSASGVWAAFGGAYPVGWCNNGFYRDDEDGVHWSNATEPYRKNPQITEFAGVQTYPAMTISVQRVGGPKPNLVSMGMNGLLSIYSMTAIGDVSQVPLLWPVHGSMNSTGVAYSSPYLNCSTSTNASGCRFNPSAGPNGQTTGLQSGAKWYTDQGGGDFTYWIYGKGYPIVRSDSSVRNIRVGSPSQTVGNNNPFNDPFATYDSKGIEWSFYPCFAPGTTTGVSYWCYFRPDRDQYPQ